MQHPESTLPSMLLTLHMQNDNSWTANGVAVAILGRFFREGELVTFKKTVSVSCWVRLHASTLTHACHLPHLQISFTG